MIFFIKKKKFKYKNFIFFSFNLRLLSEKEFKEYLKFFKEAGYLNRGYTIDNLIKHRKDIFKMFNEYYKLITALSKKTDLKIIIRPHPADELKNYKLFQKLRNVKVIKEGNISEWIYHAKMVVHSGCTGGFEASIRGLPTISYIPFVSDHGHKLADKFSKKTTNMGECIKIIEKTSKKVQKQKKNNFNKIKLRAHNLLSKKPGYKIIVNEFKKLQKEKKNYEK